jgi:hypothetical protein
MFFRYFKTYENLVEIAYYFLTILFLSPYVYIHSDTDNEIPNFVISGQNWMFGIMAVFLGWLELVLYLRSYMFPTLGLYITMFFEILKTFTRIFSVIFLFLLGYATVFYIIFPQQVSVTCPLSLLFKLLNYQTTQKYGLKYALLSYRRHFLTLVYL